MHRSCSPGEQIRDQLAADVERNEQQVLLIGSRLLGLLAVASVAVLVGGRMADQTRRVGLLKAVGGTPSLVAAVLLAEYVVVALLAAAVGLALAWLTAPLLTDPGAGLLGSPGAPSLTLATVGMVMAVALGVAVAATFVPAVRAARTSTVRALADSAAPLAAQPGRSRCRRGFPSPSSSGCGWPPGGRAVSCSAWSASRSRSAGSSPHWPPRRRSGLRGSRVQRPGPGAGSGTADGDDRAHGAGRRQRRRHHVGDRTRRQACARRCRSGRRSRGRRCRRRWGGGSRRAARRRP